MSSVPTTVSRTGSPSARPPSSWRSFRHHGGGLLVVRPEHLRGLAGCLCQWLHQVRDLPLLRQPHFYHAWIGVRDIWMDYVKPTGLRLTLHVLTIVALVGYTGWAAAILWRL